MSLWKIGARWSDDSNRSKIIVDLFRTNNCVIMANPYLHRDETHITRFNHIAPSDILCITDGNVIVALAQVQSHAQLLRDFRRIRVPETVRAHFDASEAQYRDLEMRDPYYEVKAIDVSWTDLSPAEQFAINRGSAIHKIHDERYTNRILRLVDQYHI